LSKIKFFKSKKHRYYWFISWFLYAVIGLVDQISKCYVLANFKDKSVTIFNGFDITLSFNRGVSFGFLNFDQDILFNVLSILIFIIITIFLTYTIIMFKKGESVLPNFFILAGAYSNLYDRFLHGAVVDFIDLYIKSYHWPIFNLADVFIVLGVFWLLGRMFYHDYFGKN
jgi:signal peptidase II